MGSARLRALTRHFIFTGDDVDSVEMGSARLRALTHLDREVSACKDFKVEMGFALLENSSNAFSTLSKMYNI